jgi:hypothetical protein
MSDFFLILMVLFIIAANIIGFISYKRKNLYFAAFSILLSAVLFGAIGGILAILIIRDPFAIFFGLQVGYYLMINSAIALMFAVFVTVIKRYNNRTT